MNPRNGEEDRTSVFAPDSVMWKISRERVVLLGGAAAAILQAAHPEVAAGVAAHSRFREDAFGRLHRTLEAVYTVAFGTRAEAEAMRRRIAAIHAKVRGESPVAYSAFSPEAQVWVLATLVAGAVDSYERFLGPLTAEEKAAYYEDMRVFGEYFGLPREEGPSDWTAFRVYYEAMLHGNTLCSLPLSAEIARHIVMPSANLAERLTGLATRFLAIELLPQPARGRLGFRSSRTGRFLLRGLALLTRRVVPVLPRRLRFPAPYLRALDRIARNAHPGMEGVRSREPRF